MVTSLFKNLRPISISLSPNTEKDDIYLSLKLIFHPWKWKRGSDILELETDFRNYIGTKYSASFNSGRSALLAILESLNLKGKDEILLQAFTCNAVINPILWTSSREQGGLKPVYVDCNTDSFNLDLEDLKRKITQKSRVLIVQHTFGQPADIDEVLDICKKNNLILIEDCAHSLGAKYKDKKVGIFGKAALFSFSRDKVISSVYGGMVVTNDDELAQKIREYQKKISYPSYFWIFQQLLHPILMNYIVLPTYKIIGRYFLILFQYLHILSKAVHWQEKRGRKPDYFPKVLPNALATLANLQFKKLERFNQHRKKIADLYLSSLKDNSFKLPKSIQDREHIFLRFPVRNPGAHNIIRKSWRKNILIGDWYDSPIAPKDTKLEKMQYQKGSCPKAEGLAKETFNLPTHINISRKEAESIINFLKRIK